MKAKLLRLAKRLTPFIWDRLQTVDWQSAESPATVRYERLMVRIGQVLFGLIALFFVYAAGMIVVNGYALWAWAVWAGLAFIFYRFLWVKPTQFAWSLHTLVIDLVVILLTSLLAYEVKPPAGVGSWLFYSLLIPLLLVCALFTAYLSTVARPILLMMQVRNKSHAWKASAQLTGRRLRAYYRKKIRHSKQGELTGYEPELLEAVTVEPGPWVHGTPGADGDRAELDFARSLQADGFLGKFASFWSGKVPDGAPAQGLRTLRDLDCVLVGKKRVYVIDVLNAVQGEKVQAATEKVRAAEAKVREELRQHGIKLPVSSFVVQMPTKDGAQKADLQWELNGVPVLGVLQMLSLLSKDPGSSKRSKAARLAMGVLRTFLGRSGQTERIERQG